MRDKDHTANKNESPPSSKTKTRGGGIVNFCFASYMVALFSNSYTALGNSSAPQEVRSGGACGGAHTPERR